MSDKQISDLSMNRVECPKCKAVWINGQHYWSTGAMGNEIDLASLVCKVAGDESCINPLKNTQMVGDTWEKRLGDLERLEEQTDR